MFGRVFFFLAGVYTGVIANQRYRIPDTPTPKQAWERVSEIVNEGKKDTPEGMDPELKEEVNELMDKLKALEKRYRRPKLQEGGEESGSTSQDS